jgi:hypothetical protein
MPKDVAIAAAEHEAESETKSSDGMSAKVQASLEAERYFI